MDTADKLVTIGRYSSSVEASLARNRLVGAGIDAMVLGDAAASALGLTTGMHVVELQVKEADLLRATAILEGEDELPGPQDSQAIQEAGRITSSDTMPLTEEPEEDEEPEHSPREGTADRAYLGAILGLLFWPLQVYISYLLVQVYFSNEELRPPYYRKAIIASLINVPFLMISLYILLIMGRGR